MKRVLTVIVMGMLLAGGCRDKSSPGTVAPKVNAASPATSNPAEKVYTCPMHPEVISDQPGKCPKCGMTLVPKK